MKQMPLILSKDAFDKTNSHHKKILMSLLMTACDLASVTKPFEICKDHAIRCMSEFWEEAIEQRKQSVEPNPMYLPEKKDELPKVQVSFNSIKQSNKNIKNTSIH